jgi:DNA invertase Pin-like site-specific DNA recombinase
MKKIIAYYRSSTKDQQYSIDVQRSQMKEFISRNNGYELIAEYFEHHTGKDNSRVGLSKAINHCIKDKLTLGFTRLDRLSRKASFLYQIKESGLDLICIDMPELNTLTFGIFAVMAQYERELISYRTSKTLQEIRKTKKLGNPLGWDQNRITGNETKKKNRSEWLCSDNVNKAINIIDLLNRKSHKPSLREISKNLNYHSIPTQRGKLWHPAQVKTLLMELENNRNINSKQL